MIVGCPLIRVSLRRPVLLYGGVLSSEWPLEDRFYCMEVSSHQSGPWKTGFTVWRCPLIRVALGRQVLLYRLAKTISCEISGGSQLHGVSLNAILGMLV